MPSTKVTDHLANERTYLAWVRTSIALMGFGVVIARLRLLMAEIPAKPLSSGAQGHHAAWLGLAFAAVGLVTLIYASISYERTRRAIDTGMYEPAGVQVLSVSAVIFILGLLAIGYLLRVVNG